MLNEEIWLLEFVPFVDESGSDAANFVEFVFVVDHVGAFEAGDGRRAANILGGNTMARAAFGMTRPWT